MATHQHSQTELTKNQTLVMAELSKADGPLSAYSLLDKLREQGLRAPLQVYRALDKLVEFGLVHRIESLNAFVACRHAECETEDSITFMICEDCGHVSEVGNEKLTKCVAELSRDKKFALQGTMIELRGICADCQTEQIRSGQ